MIARAIAASADWLDRLAPVVAPLFLALCIVFGGATQNTLLASSLLQLAGAGLLVWLILDRDLEPAPASARPALLWGAALLALILVQLVPLPPALWTLLPGRAAVADGFSALGAELPWAPLSLAPSQTVYTALQWLAPVAIFVTVLKLRWRHGVRPMMWVAPCLGIASVAVGLVQVAQGPQSLFYLHDPTNRGFPVGVFANANHQASFLAACLPFVGALAGDLRARTGLERSGEKVLLAVGLGAILVAGVVAAGSVAGYMLLAPALVLSVLIAWRSPRRASSRSAMVLQAPGARRGLVVPAALGLAAFAGVLAASPFVLKEEDLLAGGYMSRPDIYAATVRGIADFHAAGAGFGSFRTTFPWFEDPAVQSSTFAHHAHNDLLELLFEAGLAGALLLLVALAWYARESWRIWTAAPREETRMQRAASAALLILLLHSLVDYPLRTTALGVFAAFCAGALIAQRRQRAPPPDASGEAPALAPPRRHIVLG